MHAREQNGEIVCSRKAVLLAAFLCAAAFAPSAYAGPLDLPDSKSGLVTTTDGVEIHYSEAGRGPAILFVPGWTMPAWIWEHQMAHFSESYRVVAMDPRSQGESSQTTEGHYPAARARDLKAVVDELKLAPVVLVGWSMGVAELVSYVDQFGTDAVAALVLVDGTAHLPTDPGFLSTYFKWVSGFQENRAKATETFVRGMYKNSSIAGDEDYLQRVIQASLATPTNSAIALLLGLLAADGQAALAKIDKPVLLVVARNPAPWMQLYEEMQRKIPDCRLEVFEHAGHALFVDEAERFNALLAEFLGSVADDPGKPAD